MSNNWWCDETGRNFLRGVEGDETNPPLLCEGDIVRHMIKVPKARADFFRTLPSLSVEEQARLNDILDRNPAARTHTLRDEMDVKHKFVNRINGPIYTVGPTGGGYPQG